MSPRKWSWLGQESQELWGIAVSVCQASWRVRFRARRRLTPRACCAVHSAAAQQAADRRKSAAAVQGPAGSDSLAQPMGFLGPPRTMTYCRHSLGRHRRSRGQSTGRPGGQTRGHLSATSARGVATQGRVAVSSSAVPYCCCQLPSTRSAPLCPCLPPSIGSAFSRDLTKQKSFGPSSTAASVMVCDRVGDTCI